MRPYPLGPLTGPMTICEFRDEDRGYLDWIAANPDGFVINVLRNLNPSTARLHHAHCHTVSGYNPAGGAWIGTYSKVCSLDLVELDAWASAHVGGPITRCGICQPPRGAVHGPVARARPRSRVAKAPSPPWRVADPTAPARPAEVRGPLIGRPAVEAWANDYIRFERRPDWQQELRTEIRTRVRKLEARPHQALHATFIGDKPRGADVENLLLYNIDASGAAFAPAARFGLRFELGSDCSPSPSGVPYPYAYRYELARLTSGGFRRWRERRELARWDWVDLGPFAGSKRLEQVWLGLARADALVAWPPREPDRPFAVRVALRIPRHATAMLGDLVKGVFDGVVCALQCQTDHTTVAELAGRLTRKLPAAPEEIEALLTRADRAVLGRVPRLLHARGEGVIWAPADDLCLAGELVAEDGPGSGWQITARVIEIATRHR
jgi:hypothetical protein